ncbi:MAG TPA: outer membrane beta-barrel protein [Opitutaceae bacterium]|jgi:hypothetical protein
MLLPGTTKLASHARLALGLGGILAATTAFADVKLNDNVSLSGYAVGSYQYVDPSGGTSSDSFNLDAAKASLLLNFAPVSADLGVYYTETESGTSDLTLIDANVTYDAGHGLTITGGRFLSWMGYEAFDPVNMFQVSSAYINPSGTIMFYPAYHEGVKIKYASTYFTAGAALLDSLNGPTIYRGDGELKHNAGTELFLALTPVKGLTIWSGLGYDSKGNQPYQRQSTTVPNVWIQYAAGNATVAAEWIRQNHGPGSSGDDGLALLDYSFTPTLSSAFRVSAGKLDDTTAAPGLGFTKYTISPALKVAPHLTLRPEFSYIEYHNNGPIAHDVFLAVQALFQF